jgi:hypothetical protein
MIKMRRSSKTSVLTRAKRLNIPEDGILHSHSRENLKSYTVGNPQSVFRATCPAVVILLNLNILIILGVQHVMKLVNLHLFLLLKNMKDEMLKMWQTVDFRHYCQVP